jgi:hypothetical protein
MAMRYFKAHTLPFPSYDLSVVWAGGGTLSLTWRNGPDGAQAPETVQIGYRDQTDKPAGETVVTVTASVTTAFVTGLTAAFYEVRLRRESPVGFGLWTEAVTAEVP